MFDNTSKTNTFNLNSYFDTYFFIFIIRRTVFMSLKLFNIVND